MCFGVLTIIILTVTTNVLLCGEWVSHISRSLGTFATFHCHFNFF